MDRVKLLAVIVAACGLCGPLGPVAAWASPIMTCGSVGGESPFRPWTDPAGFLDGGANFDGASFEPLVYALDGRDVPELPPALDGCTSIVFNSASTPSRVGPFGGIRDFASYVRADAEMLGRLGTEPTADLAGRGGDRACMLAACFVGLLLLATGFGAVASGRRRPA